MINKIYSILPYQLQNFVCSVKGYLIKKRRLNKQFHDELDNFMSRKYDPETCLREFLENIKDVPYYKDLFAKRNFDIWANDIYTELKKLPILSKNEVKNNLNKFINSNYCGKIMTAHTGGTTGSGLAFPMSILMENKQWAIWWRYRKRLGLDLNTWCGWFGGKTIIFDKQATKPFWRINKPGRQIMFSAHHLTLSTVDVYYEEIVKRNITWLTGYPSQIALLSTLIKRKGLDLITSVTHITFGSENVLDSQKNVIQEIFPNAMLRQHYGLTEGVANISEDINGNLILDDDFAYVELIPLSEENPSICRIIGTGFCNEACPFVRYDTGDLVNVIYVNGKPQIRSIEGRQNEFISLPDNARLNSATLSLIFKNIPNIDESQIYQMSLSKVEFRIVKGKYYTHDDEKQLMKNIRERIDESVNIAIVYKDKIERTKNGKLRLVISDIK